MKKLFPIFILAMLSFFVMSCDNNDDVIVQEPADTVDAQMRDVSGTLSSSNSYSINTPINILSSDVVLVYRNYNSNIAGSTPVWQLLPKTYYLSGGRILEFNFLFDSTNIEIYSEGINFDQATMSAAEAAEFKTNQTFRIVLLPADPAKNANKPDYNDYNAVVKYYNLKEPK